VPDAFKGDGRTVTVSHVANQTIDGLQDRMVDKLSGTYFLLIPYSLLVILPLYDRPCATQDAATVCAKHFTREEWNQNWW